MALLTLLLFLLPFHLLPPGAKSDPQPPCPKTILCTDLLLEFPFTDALNPGCGLIWVADCNSSITRPKILVPGAKHYYPIFEMSGNNFSVAFSHSGENHTSRIGGCVSFRDLFRLPQPLSFTFSPYITLFRCVNETTDNLIDEFFKYYGRVNCGTSQCKSDSNPVCYDPTDGLPYLYGTPIPKNCSMIQLPMNEKPSGDLANLSSWLTPKFTLAWISPGCHRIDTTSEFDCNEGSNLTTVIVLAICIPGGVILLFLAGYIIWQRKKKFGGVYLLPRNISSDPSSRSFVEDGSFNFGIPIFSYTELVEATSNFDSSQELGDGGFGTVYYGKLQDGREVAIKRLYEHNYRRVEQFLNEIKILTSLRHPNLVSLYGCTSRRSRELLLVYEYISNGTVADHLHGERAKEALLTWPIRMSIARETAIALAYLHKSDIIHRDVKTTNILLDNNFSVKVADFGLSRLFPVDVTHISTAPQGTPGYVDPEYHQCYQLTDKSDVYSFGVVLIELISSMPAVDISRHRHEINLANLAVNRIQRCAFDELIDPSTGYNSDPQVTMMTTSVAELAFRCLQLEKDLRPSMDEVLFFLQDIQSGQACNFEQIKKEANGNYNFHPSPETDAALLKSKDYQSSPTAVTDEWISSSTIASSVT